MNDDFNIDWLLFDKGKANSRNQFAEVLRKEGIPKGRGVEVGTHRGVFAATILMGWKGFLYCVDPYIQGYHPGDPASDSDRRADLDAAKVRLSEFRDRHQFIIETSKDASYGFGDNTLDFVYIDACHTYESVREDLKLWFPKVRDGGIIAGHDVVCPTEAKGGWGRMVQPAVVEFAIANRLTIYVITELPNNGAWSYYFVKGRNPYTMYDKV